MSIEFDNYTNFFEKGPYLFLETKVRIFVVGDEEVVSIKDIQRLAERIAKEFKPEKIILFGSYAGGEPSPDSDVDMFVGNPPI